MANNIPVTCSRPSSNLADFRKILSRAKKITVLSGAGISAESGIPTFRGPGGYWRRWQAQNLATPEAFDANPSLVWEFYHHRREVVFSKKPNAAHFAIAEFEKNMEESGGTVTVITQNIDGLHAEAGSKKIIELHGSLFKVRCLGCQTVRENKDSPICPALEGKGQPDANAFDAQIPLKLLPRCDDCSELVRPHVVWFGESLDVKVMQQAEKTVSNADVLLIVGTSSVVYPAAAFAPNAAQRGIPVAEFNIEETCRTNEFMFHFQGPAADLIPKCLEWPIL